MYFAVCIFYIYFVYICILKGLKMTAKTSRIIIKTFVKTALKDADETPERCTRNLVDMALHFSKGRFQISFFEMARTMLNNENSPYYPLIEDALKHMDKDKLIEFGLNLGYNGCTMGAHIVRKIKRTENINVPWLLFLNIDSAHENLTESYQPIFDQGKELGIYVYFLYTNKDPEKLLPLIRQNEDCAIILLCGSNCITEDFADSAKDINHLLIGVNYDDHTDAACLVLRDHRLLYSVYRMYTEDESSEKQNQSGDSEVWPAPDRFLPRHFLRLEYILPMSADPSIQ